jgi:RHS repeat-associated protein
VISQEDKAHNVTKYAYDALGRRTLTESMTGQTLRTVYDGRSFEVIREGETFRDGSLTTQYAGSVTTRTAPLQSGQATGERYRWIGESNGADTAGDNAVQGRYGSRGVTLYGKGEAIAVSYSSSTASRSIYLGKDILGSVRSTTTEAGTLEDRYEYDAFGQHYKGDLSGGMNLGYTGKPYDTSTGLYNYGYRDYKPQEARFTTLDPIRDGNNWFAYVNNDPVNWIDLWGLTASDASSNSSASITTNKSNSIYNKNGEVAIGLLNAEGTINIGFTEGMIRSQATEGEINQNGMIGAFGKASVVNVSGKIGVGNDNVSVSLKGVGDIVTATAQAGLQYNNGFGVGLEARASAVRGRATIEFELFGFDVEVGVSGHAGSVGGSLIAGYFPSEGFKAKIGASIGLGADLLLRVNQQGK